MDHADEYHGAMIEVLELVWGEGFMAPGGMALVIVGGIIAMMRGGKADEGEANRMAGQVR